VINKSSVNAEQDAITVVIPTLGGESLQETIMQLNKGAMIPEEILVCIPKEESFNKDILSWTNVKTIKTECRGQVSQRIVGFEKAKTRYVMQLDDDVIVDQHCLEYLLETIKSNGHKVAVAPSLIDLSTKKSVYKKPNRNQLIESIYYWLMNGSSGYQPGKIDKSGTPIGVDAQNNSSKPSESEWLAGGCVMHYRTNLVLENYFPFKGKAFSEDVIHSLKLKNKGIKLLIEPKAVCFLEIDPVTTYSFLELLLNMKSDLKVRKYYMEMTSSKSIRMYLYYAACIISYSIKKII